MGQWAVFPPRRAELRCPLDLPVRGVLIQPFLEVLDPLSQALAHLTEARRAKHQQRNDEDEHPVPNAEASHISAPSLVRSGLAVNRAAPAELGEIVAGPLLGPRDEAGRARVAGPARRRAHRDRLGSARAVSPVGRAARTSRICTEMRIGFARQRNLPARLSRQLTPW